MNDIITLNKEQQTSLIQLKKSCKKISDSNISIKEAITCTDIQLSQISKDNPVVLAALLISFIKGMLLYFGRTTEDMTKEQLEYVVKDIIQTYYYLHIEDVCLCFKRARIYNRYDKFYGKIDGSVILKWFSTYDKERDEAIQSLPQQTQTIYTGTEMSREDYIEMLEAMVAGGDLYANEKIRMVSRISDSFNKDRRMYLKYQSDKKSKYSNK